MKFEIENGDYVGTAEWMGPGEVALDMADGHHREWFERYFKEEDAFLTGSVECTEMSSERRDDSPEAFQRAAFRLAAYAYTVTAKGDGMRNKAYGER
jgi:hypothetical protein